MKHSILALMILSALAGCSAGQENLQVSAASSTVPLIPATATSCLAQKQASGGTAPTADITASFFRIPKITFTKRNKANDMYISTIKITVNIPGVTNTYECTVGGDGLAALLSSWYGGSSATIHEAIIPAGTESQTTDCPLYCGGIETDQIFSATATMEIRGYEQAPGSDDLESVRTTTFFTLQNQ